MAEIEVNGVRLYYEEHGEGAPIACMHGTGGSALVWTPAVPELARLGRVIVYDRRGHTRSERPEPFDSVSVDEHVEDATALLDALDATPAIAIGRSYGGVVALNLALHHPEQVRALVLLEPADLKLSSAAAAWLGTLRDRVHQVADQDGMDAVGRAFVADVLGEGAWEALPEALRQMFTHNGPAIWAETRGEGLSVDASSLPTINQPVLLVVAEDSPAAFRDVAEAIADAIPEAQTSVVSGGHLINPAEPSVLDFLGGVLASR